MGYRDGTERRYAPAMSSIFEAMANGPYSVLAGTADTATVPDGAAVVSWSCSVAAGGAAGTVVITPRGPGQVAPAAALPTITVPPGRGVGDDLVLGRLGEGSTLAFAGTEAFLVTIFYPQGKVP